jgi:hypothetical protein
MDRTTHKYFMVLLVAVLLSSCTLPGVPAAATQEPGPAYTQAAQTIIAGLTLSAPLSTPTQPIPAVTDTPPATPTAFPSPTDTPLPTPTPSATANPEEILFADDFEGNMSWHTEQNDSFSFAYKDDGYAIYVNLPNAPFWSVRGKDYSDIRLEVDAARIDGPMKGYYGLTCRHQGEENYYALLVSSDGSYGIGKVKDGEFEFLQEGSDQAGVIKGGEAINRVRGDCIGDTLTLYANGTKLLEVQDDDFDSGDIGLIVKTTQQEGLEVLFDNFAAIAVGNP